MSIDLRNFESVSLGFSTESEATDVFESLRGSALVDSPQSLYAFNFSPRPPLSLAPAGWNVFDFKAEFIRQGIGSRTKAWRFCDLNLHYEVSGQLDESK